MDDEELERLLADVESDGVERTVAAKDSDKIGQAICAFANDLAGRGEPGVLFVGADDSGRCANLAITDRLLQNLAAFRSDGNIQPLPVMTVEKRRLGGCDLAVVTVEPSDVPPVRYKGVVWIRVGPRRGRASAAEEQRLSERRRAGDLPFDSRPVPSATLDDLDLDLFRGTYLPSAVAPEIIAENQRTIEPQLAALRLATAGADPRPTVLGLLVCGKDARTYLPGAYIQFLRFSGREIEGVVQDEEPIAGPLSQMLVRLNLKLEANISEGVEIVSGPVETRQADYPIEALRQLAYNAVLHRNYEGTNAPVRISWFSDRIEILSPGGPFGQVSIENFGQPGIVDYRNPGLAEAMKRLGYVQRFGIGIPAAKQALVKNGNPPLELKPTGEHVLAIIRRRE